MLKKFDIENFINIEYATDTRKARRKEGKKTAEFFTPYCIIKKMGDKIDETIWKDPSKTFFEPSCGNGNILLYIIYKRILNGVKWTDALKTTYAVELMEDNLKEAKDRICEMLKQIVEDGTYNEQIAREIMDNNLQCSDFFTFDFTKWKL